MIRYMLMIGGGDLNIYEEDVELDPYGNWEVMDSKLSKFFWKFRSDCWYVFENKENALQMQSEILDQKVSEIKSKSLDQIQEIMSYKGVIL